MQFSKTTLLAILAVLVQAQSIPDLVGTIPSCAVSCLTTAIGKSGCGITDYVCQCTTGHNTIQSNSAGCISSACSSDDFLKTGQITDEICSIATAAGASATSAVSSAKSVASSAASSAASVVSSAGSSASAAVTSAASGASSGASSASSAASTGASAATTSAGSPTATSGGSSSTASPSATANAGAGMKIGAAGVLGAAVVAAMAL